MTYYFLKSPKSLGTPKPKTVLVLEYLSFHDASQQTLENNCTLMMHMGVFVFSTILIEDWFLKELHRLIKLSTLVKGIDSSTTGFTFCKWTVDANKISADSCNSKMV